MTPAFDKIIPKTKGVVTKKDNHELSANIAELFGPFLVFVMKYKEQQEVDAAARRNTRGAATNTEPLHIQRIKEVLALMDKVDQLVVERKVGGLVAKFKPVSLTKGQRERSFDQDRHDILDKSYKRCVFCLHPSTNYVLENDTVVDENKVMTDTYNSAATVWNTYTAKKEAEKKKGASARPVPNPKHPITGVEMKAAPKRPNLLELIIIMCICKISQCLMKDSDTGSSCFMKCLDVGTNLRCTWDPITGRCTCLVCMCQCPAAWNMRDTNKIALGLIQLQKNGHLRDTASDGNGADASAKGVRDFLSSVLTGGILAGTAAMSDSNNNNNRGNYSTSDQEAMTYGAVMESAASMICRNSSDLPPKSRQMMRVLELEFMLYVSHGL